MSRNSALAKGICSWKVTSSKSVILLRAVLLTDRAQVKRRSLCACLILRHIRSTIFQSTSVACTAPSISSTLPPGERCDRSSERPGMGHEKEFEVFPRPAHAVLHAGLLHCSEEFAWPRKDSWLMPMARHSIQCALVSLLCKLWNLVFIQNIEQASKAFCFCGASHCALI